MQSVAKMKHIHGLFWEVNKMNIEEIKWLFVSNVWMFPFMYFDCSDVYEVSNNIQTGRGSERVWKRYALNTQSISNIINVRKREVEKGGGGGESRPCLHRKSARWSLTITKGLVHRMYQGLPQSELSPTVTDRQRSNVTAVGEEVRRREKNTVSQVSSNVSVPYCPTVCALGIFIRHSTEKMKFKFKFRWSYAKICEDDDNNALKCLWWLLFYCITWYDLIYVAQSSIYTKIRNEST